MYSYFKIEFLYKYLIYNTHLFINLGLNLTIFYYIIYKKFNLQNNKMCIQLYYE